MKLNITPSFFRNLLVVTGLLIQLNPVSAQCISVESFAAFSTNQNNPNSILQFGGWAGEGRLTADDDDASAQSLDVSGITDYLVVRNFNLNLAPDAIICGIEVIIGKKGYLNSEFDSITDSELRLMRGENTVGESKAMRGVNWPDNETAVVYGGSTDTWGLGHLTGFELNSKSFGIAFSAGFYSATGESNVAFVDYISIKVYYRPYEAPDSDNDGISDNLDKDVDNDGLENPAATNCTPTQLVLLQEPSNMPDPTVHYYSTSGTQMNITSADSPGAGVSEFRIYKPLYVPITGIVTAQDVVAVSDYSSFVLNFSKPVKNLQFDMYEVDSGGDWKDKVTVTGYNQQTAVSIIPSDIVVGGVYNSYIGNNTFVGLQTTDTDAANSRISIFFPELIDSVSFKYENINANLGQQFYSVGNITFCDPDVYGPDTDGDGYVNWKDEDSDNDGIRDLIEQQSSTGYIAPSGTDANANGLDDAYDSSQGGVTIVPVNSDTDPTRDYLDTDSDNDGYIDFVEGNDLNKDCYQDFELTNTDTDGDGLDDAFDTDNGGTAAAIQDADVNGIPDFRQADTASDANAGPDLASCDESLIMTANTPAVGVGLWSVLYGQGTFSDIHNAAATLTNVQEGLNQYAWTIYTDACHQSADDFVLDHCIAGIAEMTSMNISLYPNPAVNAVILKANNVTIEEYSLFDASSRQVAHQSGMKANNLTIDVSTLSEGCYMIIIHTEQGLEHQSLVIRR